MTIEPCPPGFNQHTWEYMHGIQPLSWRVIYRLAMLRLNRPARAERLRIHIVNWGMTPDAP